MSVPSDMRCLVTPGLSPKSSWLYHTVRYGGAASHGAMADFFISLSGKDKAWGDWIAWQLKEAGFEVVYEHWHFQTGQNFLLHMEEAGRKAARMLVVLSEHYFASDFAFRELTQAIYRDPAGRQGTVVPVVVGPCDLEGSLLGPLVYIDLTGAVSEEVARHLLLDGLRKKGPPLSPPPFPGLRRDARERKPVFPGPPPDSLPRPNEQEPLPKSPRPTPIAPNDLDSFLSQSVSSDTLADYTRWKYPDLPIDDSIHQLLISDLEIGRFSTLRDVHHAIEIASSAVEAYRKENPGFFRAGTDFVTKSLGFVDSSFRARHRFSQRTREAFAKYQHLMKPHTKLEVNDQKIDGVQSRVAEPKKWPRPKGLNHSTINPTVMAAIIGAIGAVAAALIGSLVVSFERSNAPPSSGEEIGHRGRNMTAGDIVQANRDAVVFLLVRGVDADGVSREAFGTGFLVSSRGHLITAKHVVFGDQMTNTFQIMGAVGSRYEPLRAIEFRARDPDADLVLLQFRGNRADYKTVSVCMGVSVDEGADLVTMGFPGDSDLSVIKGVLSNKNGPGGSWLADLAVVAGYDGAPVFTTAARVIGSVRGCTVSSAVFTPIGNASYLLAKLPEPIKQCE